MSTKTPSPNPPEQPADAGKAGSLTPSLTRVRRRGRRLTLQDMREVAALCSLRASEVEACAALGIPISTWKHFKSRARNTDGFAEMVDAIRGAKIKAHLANVEKFSEKDWRASIAYLEKTMPEKYSTKIEVAAPAPPATVSVNVLLALREKCYPQAKLVDAPPVKQIADATPKP